MCHCHYCRVVQIWLDFATHGAHGWVEITIIYVTACMPPWPGLNDPACAGYVHVKLEIAVNWL